jgi:cell division protein FtsB
MYRSMNWRGFVLIISLILIVFLVLHLTMQNTLKAQTEKISSLNASKARQDELRQELERRIEMVGTDDYIARSAIQNYSYVNKNDIRFEFDNPEALNRYTEDEIRILVEELAE